MTSTLSVSVGGRFGDAFKATILFALLANHRAFALTQSLVTKINAAYSNLVLAAGTSGCMEVTWKGLAIHALVFFLLMFLLMPRSAEATINK